jgi:anti-anti-sigma factor
VTQERGATRVVAIAYDVDTSQRAQFRSDLDVLKDAETAIVDLTQAGYLDSTGISELLLLCRERDWGDRSSLKLVVGPRDHSVARIVVLAGLADVCSVYETMAEANE